MTIADLTSLEMTRARDLGELCAIVADTTEAGRAYVLLAGGTDFMVEQEMRKPFSEGVSPPLMIDVSRLEGLRGISIFGDTLRIGAGTTYLEIREHREALRRAPILEMMCRDVGAFQIQARGTLGGNLGTASPAADGVPVVAAYDAVLTLRSVRGERQVLFSDLQTGYKTSTRAPDEVFVAIDLPLPRPDSPWFWRKVGTRRAQSISKVALAAIAEVTGDQLVRLGFGMASVAPVTAVLRRTRELGLSTPLGKITAHAIDKAVAADISPIDDIRSTRLYREHVACAVVRDFFRSVGAKV